ncbi:hypothetical protein ACFLY6_03315 [Candidatus Dependentiae bacterium]
MKKIIIALMSMFMASQAYSGDVIKPQTAIDQFAKLQTNFYSYAGKTTLEGTKMFFEFDKEKYEVVFNDTTDAIESFTKQ